MTRIILLFAALIFVAPVSNELTAQTKVVVVKKKKRKGVRRVRRAKKVRVAHYNYKHLPKWGYRTKVVPANTRVIVFNGVRYRYVNGVYYKPVRNGYVVVAPPKGIRVSVLPKGYRRLAVAGSTHYYYYGTYYNKKIDRISGASYYVVAQAPIGVKVDALPEGYEEVNIKGVQYYVLNGSYYKEIGSSDQLKYKLVEIS